MTTFPKSQFEEEGLDPVSREMDRIWHDVGNPDHANAKYELEKRVRTLKTELQSWKNRLEEQVATYKSELVTLKRELQQEVEVLRTEMQELRTTVKGHLDSTSQSILHQKSATSSSDLSEDSSKFALGGERSKA